MPNWCNNELKILGTKKEIEKFLKFSKGDNGILDFNKFIPYPKDFKELDKKKKEWDEKAEAYAEKHSSDRYYNLSNKLKKLFESKNGKEPKDGYNQGGYEWCIRNWGTKWNASRSQLFLSGNFILFGTPWGPPKPVIIAMSRLFPSLKFELKYFEPGNGFKGELIVKNDEIIISKEEDYEEEYI